LNGYERYDEPIIGTTGTFLFGGIFPPNKKILLRVLGVSAVKALYWTGTVQPWATSEAI
jgi:hypothetical protein